MLKYLYTFITVCIFASGFAQTPVKVFLNANGDNVIDSTKADNYVIMQQLGNDSGWYVRQYDIKNIIMTTGHYKDAQLSIPNGKFEYYHLYEGINHTQYNYAKHKTDTIINVPANFLQYSGYYVNGKKHGPWKEYFRTGNLMYVKTFKDDIQEGLYQSYNVVTGKVTVEGNMVKGERDGPWIMYTGSGDTTQTDIYKKGRITKTIKNLSAKKNPRKITDPSNTYDLIKYLNKAVAGQKFGSPGKFEVRYFLTISTDGRFNKPSVPKPSRLGIDTVVLNALTMAPPFKPATENGKPIALAIMLVLQIEVKEDSTIEIMYPKVPTDGRDHVFDMEYNSMYRNQED